MFDTKETTADSNRPPATRAQLPGLQLFARRLRFPDPAVETAFLAAYRHDAVHAVRLAVVVALVFGLAFMWQDSQISATGYRATNIRTYLITPLCAVFWFGLGIKGAERFIEPLSVLFVVLYTCMITAIFLVFEPGFYGLTGAVAEGNFVIILLATFTLSYLRLAWAATAGVAVLAIYMASAWLWSAADLGLFLNGHYANAVMAFGVGALTCAMFEAMRRRQFLTLREVESGKDRYRELLYTLLPSHIAARIERGEAPVADTQAESAILYARIAGQDALARETPPRVMAQLLNELFYEFDQAAERYGVEKVAAAGDGYMAVCGPPTLEQNRAASVARLGLEMVAITRRMAARFNLPIGIRVGVHSGSLVAGIIGNNRYTYDMAGESVSMASALEASGLPNRVQVSGAARERLAGRFELEPHGDAYLLTQAPLPG